MMRKAAAFVPAHISGFFQPCYSDVPERAGSRNCGVCLELGVITEVKVEPTDRPSMEISVNGKRAPEAVTTSTVVKQLLNMSKEPFKVEVNHSCQVPVGAGYGTSGAGALGAALALSKALGLHMAREKSTAIAHIAEVKCRTGLGDVGAQAIGGLVMGIGPGGPPHGRWKRIPVHRNLKVVCATLGPISTAEILCDAKFDQLTNELGERAINKMMEQPTLERFMSVSREFAEELGLLGDELKTLIQGARTAGAIDASQVMLGRAVFAFVMANRLGAVRRKFSNILGLRSVFVTNINTKGAMLLP